MNGKTTDIKELEKGYAIKKATSAMDAAEGELLGMLDDLRRYKRWFQETENLNKKRDSIEYIANLFNRSYSSQSSLLSALIDLAKVSADAE